MPSDAKRRGQRPPKRKPPPNRHAKKALEAKKIRLETVSSDISLCGSSTGLQNCDNEGSNSQSLESATPTICEKKLSNLYSVVYEDLENESDAEIKHSDADSDSDSDGAESEAETENVVPDGHRIIDVGILHANISAQLQCKFCQGDVEFIEVDRKGLGSRFAFYCRNRNCDDQNSFCSSELSSVGNLSNHSINRRAILAMRSIGCDRAELQTFCGVMNLPPPVHKSSHNIVNKTLESATVAVQQQSMSEAAKQEYRMAEPIEDTDLRNIDVSSDGTWMTRGHTSNIGVATSIGCVTGKVLDTGSKSKKCKSCDVWKKRDKASASYRRWAAQHAAHCTLTHVGSSGSMEADIVTDIFQRSAQKYNLRYTRFVGDGDTNTFKKVSASKPYGDEIEIEKLECVGHVQKRLGTRMRNLKRTMKGKKLADGKTLEGKGRLSDKAIDKMQTQYGSAIRANKNNLVKMRENVWGVWFHKASTDEKPLHHFCTPKCPYKKAEAEGRLQDYKHKTNLPAAVMDTIKPVFKDLAKTELLRKCVEGYTQNSNESVNGLIWKLCPKHKNHGLTTVNTAVALAVTLFNDGAKTYASVLEELKLTVGSFTQLFINQVDAERINNAQRQARLTSHEARIARRRAALMQNEELTRQEGNPYAAGAY